MTESNEDKSPRGQKDPSADAAVPEEESSQTDSEAKPGDKDMNAPPGPAEEKDRKTPDDRGLTTDTSPSN